MRRRALDLRARRRRRRRRIEAARDTAQRALSAPRKKRPVAVPEEAAATHAPAPNQRRLAPVGVGTTPHLPWAAAAAAAAAAATRDSMAPASGAARYRQGGRRRKKPWGPAAAATAAAAADPFRRRLIDVRCGRRRPRRAAEAIVNPLAVAERLPARGVAAAAAEEEVVAGDITRGRGRRRRRLLRGSAVQLL
eukprot:COSAG01_NODE_6546_length_3613_cov_16.807057_5_plen_193_part_00